MRGDRRAQVAVTLVLVVLAGSTALSSIAQEAPQTPPPTPVDGRPSPFPTDLETPADAGRPPQVGAPGALLADLAEGAVLFRKAPEVERPIASLTKIMTALAVLEVASLDDMVTVDPRAVYDADDYGSSSTIGLRAGERVSVEDLLYALLLGSANDAADALAIHVDGTIERFVGRMNDRASALGMDATRFYSPSGLDDRGRSTPADLLELVSAADRRPVLREIFATRFHRIAAPGAGPDRRIQNRNVLLWLYPGADGMKTGFTFAAGSCLVATATRGDRRLVSIVLGAPDSAFSDAAALLNHGFGGFVEETFAVQGDALGSVRVRGGTVPVIAGDDLSALVPTASLDTIEREIVVDPKAAFPPAPGDRVGSLHVRVGRSSLGSVPVLVDTVPVAPAQEGPWWERTASTIGRALVDVVAGLAD